MLNLVLSRIWEKKGVFGSIRKRVLGPVFAAVFVQGLIMTTLPRAEAGGEVLMSVHAYSEKEATHNDAEKRRVALITAGYEDCNSESIKELNLPSTTSLRSIGIKEKEIPRVYAVLLQERICLPGTGSATKDFRIVDDDGVATLGVVYSALIASARHDLLDEKQTWASMKDKEVPHWKEALVVLNGIFPYLEKTVADGKKKTGVRSRYHKLQEILNFIRDYASQAPTYSQLHKVYGKWLEEFLFHFQYRTILVEKQWLDIPKSTLKIEKRGSRRNPFGNLVFELHYQSLFEKKSDADGPAKFKGVKINGALFTNFEELAKGFLNPEDKNLPREEAEAPKDKAEKDSEKSTTITERLKSFLVGGKQESKKQEPKSDPKSEPESESEEDLDSEDFGEAVGG